MKEWLEEVYGFKVEHREITRPVYLPVMQSRIGVLHTTEGPTIESAYRTLRAKGAAPHFNHRRRAYRSIPAYWRPGAQRSTVGRRSMRTHKLAVQIEMVGFSKEQLWLPSEGTLKPTLAILAWAAENNLVPLEVPYAGWSDDCSDVSKPWAANNSRRQFLARLGKHWAQQPGWYMHLEIPGQGPSWHWDCGALKRTLMLSMAAELIGGQKPAYKISTNSPADAPNTAFDETKPASDETNDQSNATPADLITKLAHDPTRRSQATKLGTRLGTPAATLWMMLQAKTAWLVVIVAIVGSALFAYFERRTIAREIEKLTGKL